MILKYPMYTACCGRCGVPYKDEHNGFVAWTDIAGASEAASWEWNQIEGELYCNKCVHWVNADRELQPKPGIVIWIDRGDFI